MNSKKKEILLKLLKEEYNRLDKIQKDLMPKLTKELEFDLETEIVKDIKNQKEAEIIYDKVQLIWAKIDFIISLIHDLENDNEDCFN